jgi:hypothetical protein
MKTRRVHLVIATVTLILASASATVHELASTQPYRKLTQDPAD